MVRFMWAVRKAYDDEKKRWIFVGVLAALSLMLYLIPITARTGRFDPGFGLFGFWLSFASVAATMSFGEWAEFLQYMSGMENIDALTAMMFVGVFVAALALVSSFLFYKWRAWCVGVLPLALCAIAEAFLLYFSYSYTYAYRGLMAFYVILALLVVLFVVFLLLALYLPLKEPAPRPERPKRERKPTKDERIAELERQVAALRGKEKDET